MLYIYELKELKALLFGLDEQKIVNNVCECVFRVVYFNHHVIGSLLKQLKLDRWNRWQ